jgi:hypothetical protein
MLFLGSSSLNIMHRGGGILAVTISEDTLTIIRAGTAQSV